MHICKQIDREIHTHTPTHQASAGRACTGSVQTIFKNTYHVLQNAQTHTHTHTHIHTHIDRKEKNVFGLTDRHTLASTDSKHTQSIARADASHTHTYTHIHTHTHTHVRTRTHAHKRTDRQLDRETVSLSHTPGECRQRAYKVCSTRSGYCASKSGSPWAVDVRSCSVQQIVEHMYICEYTYTYKYIRIYWLERLFFAVSSTTIYPN